MCACACSRACVLVLVCPWWCCARACVRVLVCVPGCVCACVVRAGVLYIPKTKKPGPRSTPQVAISQVAIPHVGWFPGSLVSLARVCTCALVCTTGMVVYLLCEGRVLRRHVGASRDEIPDPLQRKLLKPTPNTTSHLPFATKTHTTTKATARPRSTG